MTFPSVEPLWKMPPANRMTLMRTLTRAAVISICEAARHASGDVGAVHSDVTIFISSAYSTALRTAWSFRMNGAGGFRAEGGTGRCEHPDLL